jgi:hypothetical protein
MVQWADFRLIHSQKSLSSSYNPEHSEKELNNYNIGKEVSETTRRTFKTTQTVAQDNISMQQDFLFNKYPQGIQDYRLYKTHRIRYYDEQGSNKEPSGILL